MKFLLDESMLRNEVLFLTLHLPRGMRLRMQDHDNHDAIGAVVGGVVVGVVGGVVGGVVVGVVGGVVGGDAVGVVGDVVGVGGVVGSDVVVGDFVVVVGVVGGYVVMIVFTPFHHQFTIIFHNCNNIYF